MPDIMREFLNGQFSRAQARLLCYVLGPISGLLMLHSRQYSRDWSIRFHAIHSILMWTLWATAWSALHLVEIASPWFLSTVADELQFALNFFGAVVWICLLASGYHGWRCAAIPAVHSWSVRLARRYERTHSRTANALG